MAASLLLLKLPCALRGRPAGIAPRLLASPRLPKLRGESTDVRSSSSSSSPAAAAEEPRPRPLPPLPSPSDPLRVAVVGSGPAGCYAASELFKRLGTSVRVDILDKLPTPFGLVRSGVAPDHQDTKNVTNQFERVLRDERARFFGNVEVVGGGGRRGGKEGGSEEGGEGGGSGESAVASSSPPPSPVPVRLEDLRGVYHAVVLAHGAESATPLGLPLLLARKKGKGRGEGKGQEEEEALPNSASAAPSPSPSSSGVVTARDFVLWANGHPELSGLGLDLHSLRSAVVVGAGNVALDCARLLLRSKGGLLRGTDASRGALSAALALESSDSDDDDEEGEEEDGGKEGEEKVEEAFPLRSVHVVARRGAAHAAFSARELREALSLPGVSVFVHHPPPFLSGEDDLDPADKAELAASRRAARVFELLRRKAAAEGVGGGESPCGSSSSSSGSSGSSSSSSSSSSGSRSRKELHFHFLRSPVELIAAEGGEEEEDGASSSSPRVAAVRLVANRLETRREGGKGGEEGGRTRRVAVAIASLDDDGGETSSSTSSSPSASSFPTFLTLPAQLVIAALGFRTPSLGQGTPFDERKGVVPSGGGGRVLFSSSSSSSSSPSSSPSSSSSSSSPPSSPHSTAAAPPAPHLLPGLYVTGWARRGPSGIIGENLRDAAEVADAVAADAAELMTAAASKVKEEEEGKEKESSDASSPPPPPSSLGLPSLLQQQFSSPRVVGVEGWGRIDALERERAAREVEGRAAEAKKKKARGGKEVGDASSSSSCSAVVVDAPPRVKLLTAEELLRAAGV